MSRGRLSYTTPWDTIARDVQRVFDRIVDEPWFVRDQLYEQELGSYMIHLYLNGMKERNILYELCASAALRRYRTSNAA